MDRPTGRSGGSRVGRLRIMLASAVLLAGVLPASATPALAAAPSNDFFAFAKDVSALPYADLGVNTTLATTEVGEPGPSCSDWDGYQRVIANSVWYRYVAPASTTLSASLAPTNLVGNSIVGVVAVYDGTAFNNFGVIGCASASNTNGQVHLAFPVTASHTYYIQVGGKPYGGPSGAFDFTVVDNNAPVVTPPTVTAPVASLPSGTTHGKSGVRVRTTWAGTPQGSPIVNYVVQRSDNGGAWATVGTIAAKTATWTLSKGQTYQFRVQAVDAAGRTSAWATGGLVRPLAYQEGSSAIAYRGTWTPATQASAYGGRLRHARVAGARATFTFTGRSVAWVSTRAPSRGYAKVYVNGVYTARINLAASATTYRRVVWARTWPTAAKRTVRIVVEGTRGHPRVDVDAFLVLR